MSNDTPTDQELKTMLSPRSIPAHDERLAQDIMARAARIPQREPIWQRVSNMFEEFKIPAPAYTLAAVVIIGFASGVGIFGDIGSDAYFENDTTSTFEFLLEEDSIL